MPKVITAERIAAMKYGDILRDVEVRGFQCKRLKEGAIWQVSITVTNAHKQKRTITRTLGPVLDGVPVDVSRAAAARYIALLKKEAAQINERAREDLDC